MINCPKCQATLPDGSGRCQFCNTTFTAAPVRPGSDLDAPTESVNLKWVWPAYYAIAGWWIFNGLYGIVQVLLSKHAGSFWGVMDIAISSITALVGLGLILRVELARGIVNVLCFLQILQGLFGVLGGFIMSFAIGIFGAIAMVMSILQIIIAVLMVFVIGETEGRAANL
jgi:hypothetical protein